jgi:putative IMPACT (imprinted ancient) family translation regulator
MQGARSNYQLAMQQAMNKYKGQKLSAGGCMDLYKSTMNTCNRLTGDAKQRCLYVAQVNYQQCMGG